MPVVGYSFRDIPRRIAGAFTPMPALTPRASSNGILRTRAIMGQTRVPAPPPAAVPVIGPDKHVSPSNVAPDWIMPQIYVDQITEVMNPSDARFSWMPPFTVIPPTTGEVVRIPDIAFNPYPGLADGTTMTWPRGANRFASITQPGVTT